MGLFGHSIKKKIAAYKYPKSGSKHRFGFLIDETDSNIVRYLSEVEKHPFFKGDSKVLSFRNPEITQKYDYSYLKTDVPYNKWPVQKEVESFISHEFEYFFPLIKNWQIHQEIICKLVRSKIKFADKECENTFQWDICYNKPSSNPMEFLKFASTFINK